MKTLLVIPNDSMQQYIDKGYSERERTTYFNPDSFFDKVDVLSWKEDQESEYAGIKIHPFLTKHREAISDSLKDSNYSTFLHLIEDNIDELSRIIQRTNPNIIRGYNGNWAAFLSGYIGRRYSIPSLASVHDQYSTRIDSLKEVDLVLCVSNVVKETCRDIGILEDKLVVAQEGIDLNLFYKREGKEVDTISLEFPGTHKILSVGRLCKEKNLENLLRAIAMVNKHLPGVIHIHAGIGYLQDKIQQQILDLGLKNTTHLLGTIPQEELPAYYSWAKVFILSSKTEGLGNVLIEALACETPVITSNIPPMNNIITNKFNGLTVNHTDPNDIAQKTIELLTDNHLYSITKSNARKSVQDYSKIKRAKEEAKIYEEMLK